MNKAIEVGDIVVPETPEYPGEGPYVVVKIKENICLVKGPYFILDQFKEYKLNSLRWLMTAGQFQYLNWIAEELKPINSQSKLVNHEARQKFFEGIAKIPGWTMEDCHA